MRRRRMGRGLLFAALLVMGLPRAARAQEDGSAVDREPVAAEEPEPPGSEAPEPYRFFTGAFVGFDWRINRIGRHTSHGPGFQAGVMLWRHLRVGLAGFARPGPINPATFEVTPVDGQTYRGRPTVTLRSDGSFFGLMLAPTVDLGEVVALEAPITLGQAAFGFYLTGEDRDTPDGRRVSGWENDLLDGRDASIAFGWEAGLRVSFIATSWARPYVGAHYFGTVGYDAFVRDDYSGFSAAAGLQLGRFR